MSAVNQVWLAKGLSDLKWWSVAIDICQPSVPPFSETPLIQSVSLCLTVNQHRCEQPACRQLNNQTLHQTCSALPSGDRRKWQQGERAMGAKKKVVERERTKESALALLSLREGWGWGGGQLALPSNIYLKEKDFSLSAYQWESRDNLFFLLSFFSNKDKEKTFQLLM